MKKIIDTIKEITEHFVHTIKMFLSDSMVIATVIINIVVEALVGPTILAGVITGVINMTILIVLSSLFTAIFVTSYNAYLDRKYNRILVEVK